MLAGDYIRQSQTRLIAMGERPLMEGFSLLGFETFPDADEHKLQQLLIQLIDSRQAALVLLQTHLARSNLQELERIRQQGGRIIITEIPPLNAAADFSSVFEQMLIKNMGKQVLEHVQEAVHA